MRRAWRAWRGRTPELNSFLQWSSLGAAVGFIPFILSLTAGRWSLTRTARPDGLFSNVFDMQAQSLLHGHWDVGLGSLGIESFNMRGGTYTYFPPFPAFLRMPILAVTDAPAGKLTAPSMLLAWVVTIVSTAALVWTVRRLVRADAPVTTLEGGLVALLLASIGGGSLLVFLASAPWVYHEVYAWSIALAMLCAWRLTVMLVDPTPNRAVHVMLAVTALILTRTTVGAGAVVSVALGALVFFRRRAGDRLWWKLMLVAAAVPVIAACAVTWAKFGSPFNFLPLESQAWTQVNAHRRDALAANGGGLTNIAFMPTTLAAYLSPLALRLRPYFPYISLPDRPPHEFGGVVFDQTYRTGSATAFMPLLTVLCVIGIVAAVRWWRRRRPAALAGVALVGWMVAIVGILNYGYMAHRYSGDIVPLLITGSCLGVVALPARWPTGTWRFATWGALAVLAVWGLVANGATAFAMSAKTAEAGQLRDYVEGQLDRSPSPRVAALIDNVALLPTSAAADRIAVVRDCDAMFFATGETHEPWIYLGGDTQIATVDVSAAGTVPLATLASTVGERLDVRLEIDGYGWARVTMSGLFERHGPWVQLHSSGFASRLGARATATVRLDAAIDLSTWVATVDDQRAASVPLATYDARWSMRYLTPAAVAGEGVKWTRHADPLCARLTALRPS